MLESFANRVGASKSSTSKSKDAEVATELAIEIGKAFDRLSADEKDEFRYSNNTRLKDQLTYLMRAAYSRFGAERKFGWHEDLPARFRHIVETAVDSVAMKAFVDQPDYRKAKDFGEHVGILPNIHVKGEEFRPTRVVGSGSFASAIEYSSVLGDSKIILKVMNEEVANSSRGDAIDGAGKEARAHQKLAQSKSPNSIDMSGVLRLRDGRIAIAMELAENGKVSDIHKQLQIASEEGVLTPAVSNVIYLTILRDMASGLKDVHEKSLAHLDFHMANIFVDKDGTSKVGDLGLSVQTTEGRDLNWVETPTSEAFSYLAPELAMAMQEANARRSERSDAIRSPREDESPLVTSARSKVDRLLPKANKNAREELISNILEEADKSARSHLYFNKDVDIWSFGATALKLFTGSAPSDHLRNEEQLASVADYGVSGAAPLSDPDDAGRPKNGAIGVKTGDKDLDRFLSRTLQADPKKRPSASSLVKDKIFFRPGVGSPEIKALIVAMAGKDPGEIAKAKDAFDNAFPPQS